MKHEDRTYYILQAEFNSTKGEFMIEVNWGNPEKNIVIWEFFSPWTWNEFYDAKKQVDVMIDAVSGVVDSIFLTTVDQKIPPNAIGNFQNIIGNRHERHDLIVLVGSKSFLSALLNVVVKWIPGASSQFRYVHSQEEAYNIIAKAQDDRRQNNG